MFLKTRLLIGFTVLAFVAMNIKGVKERFANHDSQPLRPVSVAEAMSSATNGIKEIIPFQSLADVMQVRDAGDRHKGRYLSNPEPTTRSMTMAESMCSFYPDQCK